MTQRYQSTPFIWPSFAVVVGTYVPPLRSEAITEEWVVVTLSVHS